MNLLMCAPLLDSRGNTKYFIGAQVDVSGLCKDGTDLPGLQRLIAKQEEQHDQQRTAGQQQDEADEAEETDTFQELAEMFNETELSTVHKHGGKMHREQVDENGDPNRRGDRPRLLIKEPSDPATSPTRAFSALSLRNGKLEGVYQNVSYMHIHLSATANGIPVSLGQAISFASHPFLLAVTASAGDSAVTVFGSHRWVHSCPRHLGCSACRRSWCDRQSALDFW